MQSQILRLERVDFAFGPCEIVRDVNLVLPLGWTGLVGANGSGKSTLLRLMHGVLEPDRGQIRRDGLVSHLCQQSVDELDDVIEEFASSWDRQAIRSRAALDLDAGALERWSTLSPGERKRWQIAAALHTAPDILLLDEPSNHLDGHALGQLLEALRAFRGIGIVVSHDRRLLDAVTTKTLFVTQPGVASFVGNYSAARNERDRQRGSVRDSHAKERSKEELAHRRLVEAREKQTAAQGKRSAATRMKNRRDSDARSSAAKARATKGEARRSRSVALTRKRASDASTRRANVRVRKDKGRELFVNYQPAPMSTIVSYDQSGLYAGDRKLLSDVQVRIRRDTRARLVGANGSGKTTLMRALLHEAAARREHLLYLPQNPKRPACFESEDQVYNIVAALGADPARLKESLAPSPGEIRKFLLAQGLARGAWALLLDEPTNHLDLPSIERLQAALADYPGALLIVTHDNDFAEALTTETWSIRDGTLRQT